MPKRSQKAISGQLATKTDLTEGALKLEARMTRIDGDITLLKWMLGFTLLGVGAGSALAGVILAIVSGG